MILIVVELGKQGIFDGSEDILSRMWQNFNKKLRFGCGFSCYNGLGEDKGD